MRIENSTVRSTPGTERRFERAVFRVLRPTGKHDFRLRQECPPQRSSHVRQFTKQLNPTAQTANEGNRMRLQRALSLLQLLIGETIVLFIAGIAVPSFLRSGTATNHALAARSLHILTIAPVTFSYTFQNVGFAILGALCGAAMALVIDSPATIANAARIVRMLRKNSRRSHLGNRKLA